MPREHFHNPFVCPAYAYSFLDNKLRRLVHDPRKICGKYISAGQSALDIGCGPGYFTFGLAEIVGPLGQVLAVDIQPQGLELIQKKSKGTVWEKVISTHLAKPETLALTGQFDLILNFWMLHEVPDQKRFIKEIAGLMKPGSKYLLVEPKGHVGQRFFAEEIKLIETQGLQVLEFPKVWFSRAVVFQQTAK
jgi:ubiquinone/menaquinone biosynthesis C-methylase UbiE